MCRTAEEFFGVYYGIMRNRGYAGGGALLPRLVSVVSAACADGMSIFVSLNLPMCRVRFAVTSKSRARSVAAVVALSLVVLMRVVMVVVVVWFLL